jgi:UDP-N-acetylglucosamine:LPS N-acetylglucosamine transferase
MIRLDLFSATAVRFGKPLGRAGHRSVTRCSDHGQVQPLTTLDLIYFNAGGGHRAAATALQAVIVQQQRPWQLRCINLVDLLDPQARFRRLTGIAPEDLYNLRLARGWTLGLAQELKLLQAMIALGHATLVRRLQRHWSRSAPDLVVSLIPNFNRAMFSALAAARPGAPFVTLLTDLADHPPNFWIEPGQAQHFICGSAKAEAQALALGHDASRVHRSSGMVIRPDFYQPLALDRRADRVRLGLDPDRPTGVVMFGGQGSMAMLAIARDLADVQLVLMCGHHRELARRLRALRPTAAHLVVEFTPEVRRHLALGDFLIGKPGPGSLSEAVQQGLPVLTVRNTWTMPQERYNTDWVQHNGLGLVVRSMRKLRPAVLEMLRRLDEFKQRVAQIENRAVFEVPDILAGILDRRADAAAV